MDDPAAAVPTGRAIAVFSDGTGNSAAKLNKTNVWRLYQALDLRRAPGGAQQIALYDDGVGTSGFKPLALLGGVFGYGLKRNVLDLYRFLCRNYQPGDRIHAFGFSRGAFTIRVLMGLVLNVGLVPYTTEQALDLHVQDAWRRYRRRFKATVVGEALRTVRDRLILAWRTLRRASSLRQTVTVDQVAFVGGWDTVAAYGMPFSEMTRAIDRWIVPLSMPNYALSPKVRVARHALALDDERDTFHPLLWDEVAEARMVAARQVAAGRLEQVWFAGMHSDVGGGYPNDSLAYVSLEWMMAEAEACGLRFSPGELDRVRNLKDACGPIHDSRSGLGTYYRYQPRRLEARLPEPNRETLLMLDPDPAARGHVLEVVVHPSVIERVRNGFDGYSPIVLPPGFRVLGDPRTHALELPATRVWNTVWRRRLVYFLSLGITLAFLLVPMLPVFDCVGPQCLASPAITAAGAMLPDALRPWIVAWAGNPAAFLGLLAVLAMALASSKALQRATDDRMSEVWASLDAAPAAPAPLPRIDRLIQRLRSSAAYQRSIQYLKWRALPALFGALFAGAGLLALTVLAHRSALLLTQAELHSCPADAARPADVGRAPTPVAGLFATRSPCWPTGLRLEAGARYRLLLDVQQPWVDGHIPASPEGFASTRFGLVAPVFAPFRRATAAPWFAPVITVRDAEGHRHSVAVSLAAELPRQDQTRPGPYAGEFVAPATGAAFLYVNDALIPSQPIAATPLYANNQGTAAVSLQRLSSRAAD